MQIVGFAARESIWDALGREKRLRVDDGGG